MVVITAILQMGEQAPDRKSQAKVMGLAGATSEDLPALPSGREGSRLQREALRDREKSRWLWHASGMWAYACFWPMSMI